MKQFWNVWIDENDMTLDLYALHAIVKTVSLSLTASFSSVFNSIWCLTWLKSIVNTVTVCPLSWSEQFNSFLSELSFMLTWLIVGLTADRVERSPEHQNVGECSTSCKYQVKNVGSSQSLWGSGSDVWLESLKIWRLCWLSPVHCQSHNSPHEREAQPT